MAVNSAIGLQSGTVRVPLPGAGTLSVTIRTGTSRPVLAIHGISSNSRLWVWLLKVAPNLTLIMPDLRGRGESLHLSSQSETVKEAGSNGKATTKTRSSIQQHAADMATVLDYLGLEQSAVDVLGMSMGGFVAICLASAYPDKVRSLTLVDGGPPMRPPAGLTPSTKEGDVSKVAFNDRVQRLNRKWSLQEYKEFFTSSTAPLLSISDPLLDEYLRYDLGIEARSSEEAPSGRVRLSLDSLIADAADIFSQESLARWEDARVRSVPTRLSRAEWSSGRDTEPAYGPEERKTFSGRLLREELVPGQDHAGTIMTLQGAEVARGLLEDALHMNLL